MGASYAARGSKYRDLGKVLRMRIRCRIAAMTGSNKTRPRAQFKLLRENDQT
jgi:hypothetical protein